MNAFLDAVFKNEVARAKTKVILDLLLDAGSLNVVSLAVSVILFGHFSKSKPSKPFKSSQISCKIKKARKYQGSEKLEHIGCRKKPGNVQ